MGDSSRHALQSEHMAIDEPISALQNLNASDERQRSPILSLSSDFLRLIKLLAPVGSEIPLSALEGAVDWLSRRSAENRAELVNVIAEELKFRATQIERLLNTSEEHRRFMADEMPALVVDALRRAEQARAKDRIRRLGRILVHAAEVGNGADYAEELMRIALEMTDRDIVVLREIHRAMAASVVGSGRGATPHMMALQHWRNIVGRLPMTQGETLSTCLKLEGYGLLRRAEDRSRNNLADEPLAFGLLQKGKDFVDYLHSSAQTEA